MTEPGRNTREPAASKFTQQELSAFRPVLNPSKVVFAYLLLTFVLIPIGAFCLFESETVVELKRRYDDVCLRSSKQHERIEQLQQGTAGTCTLGLTVEKRMEKPVYVYYELDSYYQNHRSGDKSDCKPKLFQLSGSGNNIGFDESLLINPCGLAAWSFFNDSITIERQNGDPITMDESGIAWESDIKHKFADYTPTNFNDKPEQRGGGVINGAVSKDEHFIVWMRTAALPQFRKLYGIINEDLEAGDDLTIVIENRYNTYLFGGKKKVILSTTSRLGGHSPFLGILYIAMGAISFAVACLYFVLHMQFPRMEGDERFLSWKRKKY